MSKTAQGLRPRLEWRLLFLSSGELSLTDHVASVGKRLRGGAEVRLIYIPANAGKGFGLFEDLHTDESGCSSGHEFAKLLAENTNLYYGTALRPWLGVLTKNRDALCQKAREMQRVFEAEYQPKDPAGKPLPVAGEVSRVLATLGAIAAAGELAAEYGITGWSTGQAIRGVGECFKSWWARRGAHGSSDLETAIRQVRLLCEKYEISRFEVLDVTPEAKEYRVIQERFGYREVGSEGETVQFFVLPEAWRYELCRGYDAQAVARELRNRGLLVSQPPGLQFKKRIKGESMWTYSLSGRILAGEDESS
jgi:putative DNA primase/helicase